MTNRFRHILWAAAGLAAAAGVALLVLWRGLTGSSFPIAGTEYVYVRPTDDAESVARQLDSLSGGGTRLYWHLLNVVRPYTPRTGRYAVSPGASFAGIYRDLLRGHQSPVRFTLPSVRTLDRLAGVMGRRFMLDSAAVASAWQSDSLPAAYGYTPATLPALFIPNTYEIYWDISLDAFMQRMAAEAARFWEQDGRAAAARDLGLTRLEVMTLASIVDEETANTAEKPRVAGLYMNRLRKGIPLQADPTVKFAVGAPTLRRIRSEHLRTDSPYNTYIFRGLPPGPIRIPSINGIDAVLHMEHHDYLFMCAKEDFSGTHNFAATFAEHLRNARRYQQALNQRGIR